MKKQLYAFAAVMGIILTACGSNEDIAESDNLLNTEERLISKSETEEITPEENDVPADNNETGEGALLLKDISGEWVLSGDKTAANLKTYASLQELFGTGLKYGNSLQIYEDGRIEYYIGIGVGGEGTCDVFWTEKEAGIMADITSYEGQGGDAETLIIKYTEEESTPYLVMDYSGEELYWMYNGTSGISDTAGTGTEPDNEAWAEEQLRPDNETWTGEQTSPEYFMVENPGYEYYCHSSLHNNYAHGHHHSGAWNTGSANTGYTNTGGTITLDIIAEEENDITDTEKWFKDNGLDAINSDMIEDNRYYYELEGNDGYSRYLIHMYDKESGEQLRTLDFSQYCYADEYRKEDYNFIEQKIWWVQSVGDILYVAIAHNTYTESCPHNGYILAYDLLNSTLLWKSAPCMTNARTFEIIDGTIVCGYGFTSEPDYLNLINISDGRLIQQIPIKTMAEYIICKDDVLYVRTYNTNYKFQVRRGADNVG